MLEVNFSPFPELKSSRLLLRQLTEDDAGEIYFIRSNEDVLRYVGRHPARSIEEAEDWIVKINKSIDSNESILWGITLLEEPGNIIGTICLWNMMPEHYRAEIGYVLHPGFWSKGIMTEAIDKVMDYAFHRLQLHSVEARTNVLNVASNRTLEKSGFVREGHLREEFYFNGVFHDTFIYSKLNNK